MNISNNTIEALREIYNIYFTDDNVNEVSVGLATELHIAFEKATQLYIGKTVKTTKKETTFAYVIRKLNADKVYTSFCETFNTVISKFGLNAYPTTYGIGIFVSFGFRKDIEEKQAQVEKALKTLGVNFTTEYSDAGWVFRYKISKASANINALTIASN